MVGARRGQRPHLRPTVGKGDRPRFASRRLRWWCNLQAELHAKRAGYGEAYHDNRTGKAFIYVGLDVHKETIAVAVAEVGKTDQVLGIIPNKREVRSRTLRRGARRMRRRRGAQCTSLISRRRREVQRYKPGAVS